MSTSIPIASPRPASVIILIEMPEKYIINMANSTENGMLNATTSVGLASLKNKTSTSTASSAPVIMLCKMLLINIVI